MNLKPLLYFIIMIIVTFISVVGYGATGMMVVGPVIFPMLIGTFVYWLGDVLNYWLNPYWKKLSINKQEREKISWN